MAPDREAREEREMPYAGGVPCGEAGSREGTGPSRLCPPANLSGALGKRGSERESDATPPVSLTRLVLPAARGRLGRTGETSARERRRRQETQ